MRAFRLLWLLHRWVGVAVGLVLLVSATTGFLLLKKKGWAWIQPPAVKGEPGPVESLKTLQEVYAAVFALNLPEFRTEADIARVDFRPSQRVHKLTSVHDHAELQVRATTLRTSGPKRRVSDWLEQVHDGSWFGDFAHAVVLPIAALALLFLGLSGYVKWLSRSCSASIPDCGSLCTSTCCGSMVCMGGSPGAVRQSSLSIGK